LLADIWAAEKVADGIVVKINVPWLPGDIVGGGG